MRKSICLFFVLLLTAPFFGLPESKSQTDAWEPLRVLEGRWEAVTPGVSTITQTYDFILGGKFLQMKTRGVFEPTEKKPNGEIHEDLGMFSYDRARGKFIMRGFYAEGFVNRYVMEPGAADGKTLTFTSEHIENAPDGTRAKLEFKIVAAGEIEQSFHVAWPGKDFACYSVNKLKRKK